MSLTIAEAESSSGTNLVVSDTAANIAQGLISAPGLVNKVASFTLSASGTVSAAQAEQLAGLGSRLHLGGFHLTVQDTLANLGAPANAAGVALATSVGVADAAFVLLSAPLSRFAHIAYVTLTGAPTLSVAEVTHLLLLPHFSIAPSASVTLFDTAGNIGSAISGNPAWFHMVSTIVVHLDGSQVGAYSAGLLEGAIRAGAHVSFMPSQADSTLNITAPLAGIAGNAPALAMLATHVPLAFTISGTTAPVGAAAGASLAGLAGFASHLSGVTVADSAANVAANAAGLFGHGFAAIDITSGTFAGTAAQLLDPSLHLQGASATLAGSATVSAANALTLAALHGFGLGNGAVLTVSDSISALLAHGSALIGLVSAMVANDSETLDAADATRLAAIAAALGTGFSLGGHTLTVSDSASALLGLPAAVRMLAGSLTLNADSQLDAADFTALSNLAGFSPGGHAITVADTADALAAIPSNRFSLIQSVTLTQNASVLAAEAALLGAEPNFSTGGNLLAVTGSASALLALSPAVTSVATSLDLAASTSVTASQLTGLSQFGHRFSTNGFTLTVSDNAAGLYGLGVNALALAGAAVLNQSATVGVAEAQALAGLPSFSKAPQVVLTVQDSLTNLLALNGTAPSAANIVELTPGTSATLTAASAALLADLAGFSNAGATITVADSIENLQSTPGWPAVANLTDVIDTAANLIAGAALPLVQNAASVSLAAGATIDASGAAALASIPHFSRAGNLLIVADSAAAIVTNAAAVTAEASLVEVTGAAPVLAAGADVLAQVAAAVPLTFLNGTKLVIADSYADIVAPANAAGVALAAGLTIEDSAANLGLAALHNWGTISPTYELTASGTVSAAELGALSAAGNRFAANGYSLALSDTATGVIGLSAIARDMAASIAITDISASLTTPVLNILHGDVTVPLSITLTDSGHVSVSTTTYSGDLGVIDSITNAGAVIVTGTAGNIANLAAALENDPVVGGVAITDSPADIQSQYGILAGLTMPVSFTLNASGTVNAATLALLAAGNVAEAGYSITLADTESAIAGLSNAERALAAAVTVDDNVADLGGAAFDALQALVSQPLTIHLSDPADPLMVTANTYANDRAQVDAVNNASVLAVTGGAADISPLVSFLAADSRVTGVVLTDTASDIDALAASLTPLAAKLAITLTGGGTVGAATLALFANAASLSHGGINLALASNVAGVTGLSATARDLAGSIAITDVSTSLTTAALNTLKAAVGVPLTITLTDAGHITVSATTYTADASVIDSIQNAGVVTVADTAANIAGLAYTLDNDPVVGGVAITDGAGAIQTNYTALDTISLPIAITLNASGTVSANTMALIAGSSFVSGGYVITLADSEAAIAGLSSAARALAGAVTVNDSVADLTSGAFDTLRADVSVPLTIHLSDPGDTLTVTAATYAADTAQVDAVNNAASLLVTGAASDIAPHATALAADSRVTGIVLTDTATDIDGLVASLTPLAAKLAITLTGGGTVGAATLALFANAASLSHGGINLALASTVTGVTGLSATARDLAGSIAITDVSTSLTTAALNTLKAAVGVPLTITLTDAGHITVSATTYTADASVIDSIQNAGVVTVADTAANIAGLAYTLDNDPVVGGVAITDGAGAIQTNYTALDTISLPIAITLNASGTVSANTLALIAGSSFVSGGYVITLADSEAAIAGLSSAARALAGAVTVNDSVADLTSGAFDTLRADVSVPLTIHLSDPGDTLTVTAATYAADTAQVDAVNNAASLLVTGAASDIAPHATALAADSRVTGIVLTDTATDIDGLVASLTPLAAKLAITLTGGGPVGAATLALFANAASLSHGGINLALASTVNGVTGLSATARDLAGSIAITDVSTSLTTAALNTLKAAVGVPLTITLTDAGHITVSATTYTADASVIDSIQNAGVVTVADTAANIAGLAYTLDNDPVVGGVAITDGAGAIQTNYTALDTIGLPIAITLNASGTVSANTLALIAGSSFVSGGYVITLADSEAAIAGLSSAARALAGAVTVNDSVADLTSGAFDTLRADVSVPLTIHLSDPGDTLTVTAATYAADTAQVDAVNNAASLLVTGNAAALAPLAATLAADGRITSVALTDSATDIDALVGELAAAAAKLAITVTQGGAVSAATLTLLANAASVSDNGITYTLAGSVGAVTGLTSAARNLAGSIAIADVSTNLTTAALNALHAEVAVPLTITLTDSGSVTISAATYGTDQSTIDAIQNTGSVIVTGAANAFGAVASALGTDPVVGAVQASGTAALVASNLTTLLQIGSALTVTLTDTQPIAATLVPSLVELPSLVATGITVADTGSNIAAVIESGNSAAMNFLNDRAVALNANSVVSMLDAQSLLSLANFSDSGYALEVWDTAARLTNSANLATLQSPSISAIYLKTTTPLVETAAAMLALLALPNFHFGNPDGSTNSVTLSDSTGHLSADYTALHADAAQLAGIPILANASAAITDSVLAQLQTLGVTAAGGVVMTVRDTAATIAANAPSQAASTAITATNWDLSGSSTVSESVAAYLGGLAGFQAGAYTLTVNQVGPGIISVADANNLANLGSALAISGGGTFAVDGTVSQLSGLSVAARALVSANITDSFSNIVNGLTAGSTLLTGTLAVNDSESVTAANAEAFFNLIKVGNSAGIAPANVSLGGHVEAVSGVVSDLQTLTGLAAWTQNASLAAAFTLTAADSVANLINPSNRSFLASLPASTLSGNSTTTAANAEALFLAENQIHFSKAGNHLTVQDSAADLLNPANSDGVALADTLSLLGNDSTTAAGAETLLSNSKFELNHVLTIADTSDNLLDGVLGPLLAAGDYGSNIVVELSGATVLDAPTAAELVALSGFADPSHELTISDDPSYLVQSAYLAAETIAATVTIPTDESVTAAMVYRLDQVPHFTPGSHFLDLSASSTVNDATLAAIGDMGAQFAPSGHSITMTADDILLSATEYNALLSDNVVTNGHLFGAVTPAPTVVSATDVAGEMNLTMNVAASGAYHVFDASGNAVTINSATAQNAGAGELLTFADSTSNFTITESLGNGAPSAPVVLLDTASLTAALGSGTFATTGGAGFIMVGTNEYVQLTNSVPASPTVPILVYDGTSHVLSLDVPGSGLTPLVTLGGTAPPATLSLSEIAIKTHG